MYKVLVVDDEPLMLEGWKTMVDWEAYGYQLCGTATDGAEALANIQACDPDLVVTDIRMPVLDGLGLIRAMKEDLGHSAKTIIVSGFPEFGYAQQALIYQVDRYILKPLVTEEIHSLLLELAGPLEERRLEEASAGKKQAAAAAASIVSLLADGEAAAVDTTERLLGASDRTRCRLILAEPVDGPGRRTERGAEGLSPHAWLNELSEALTAGGGRAWTFEEAPGRAGLLLLDGGLEEEELEVRLMEAAAKLGRPLRELALYCSGSAFGLAAVPRLYRQVLETRSRALLAPRGGVHRHQGRKAAGEWRLEEMSAYVEELLQSIEACDSVGIGRAVDGLVGLFVRTGAEEGWVKAAVRYIQGELLRRFAKPNAGAEGEFEWMRQLLRGTRSAAESWNGDSLKRLCVQAAERLASRSSPARANGTFVSEAVEYLKRHFRERIRLQDLADRFYINPAYFGQQFKRETGCGFHDYIHRLRIDEARRMLRRTDLLVSDIASELGYHDSDYFTDKFKALTGELPSAYKNKRQG
ncbi:helix-turn-helix domain-containing protein [Cohnella lubricantis]|uniref:Helix-turn-helix domain-containing protein n=2 Tax=Cohnella lubricantis TaxID=2163172 RepID=A0A841TBP2_9BACL|nr:helix-turn-helix domain-containing protein [Cohnella lubricantis]